MTVKECHIIHLDMDAFFASVEILDNPNLRGKPVIVGGGGNRGVVAAASYGAREYGIHSAMPIVMARRLCPEAAFMSTRLGRYQEISALFMAIFRRFTPLVEPLSIDEAFLDVKDSLRLFGSAVVIAKKIRAQVLSEIGLTISAGVADSKLTAKIASDCNKPDGLTIVPSGRSREFLAPLPIERLWGVGKKTHSGLRLLGVATIGDLARIPMGILTRKFGRHGMHLYNAARAEDGRAVEPYRPVKSMGNEETFVCDLVVMVEIKRQLLALALKVAKRLRWAGLMGRTLTIKVKYADFIQVTKSKSLRTAIDDHAVMYKEGCCLLAETMAGRKPLRLLGLSITNLVSSRQPIQDSLFNGSELNNRMELNRALDQINERFGNNCLQPGALVVTDIDKMV